MYSTRKQDDEAAKIAVSKWSSAVVLMGWVAMVASQYDVARAHSNSVRLAFAGLTPRRDRIRIDAQKSGWFPRNGGLMHVPSSELDRRKLVDISVSSRLGTFPFGAVADSDSSDETEKGDEEPGPSKPVQTNFDQLFTGMPKINEILGEKPNQAKPLPNSQKEAAKKPIAKKKKKKEPSGQEDSQWLEQKMEELKDRYDERLEEAVARLDVERKEDPGSVPDSAYAAVESMLKEEMETELSESREQRFQDILKETEERRMEELENMDLSGVEDPIVEEILKEANAEADRQDAVQAEMDSFSQLERDALRRVEKSDVALPESDADLDEWALERLEEMLASQQNGETGAVSETLEESIDELRDRLESKKDSNLIQPETMKEWQMYRSIATRLSKEQSDSASENVARDGSLEDEEAIAAQLQSWKEFEEKEQEYRRQSGLASGVKMPFEWQEAGKDPMDVLKPPEPIIEDNRTPSEVRAELNLKALAAMEDLLKQGTIRSERLGQKIEELKKALESPEELHEEENEPTESKEPVDLTGVFGSNSPLKEPPSPRSSTWIEETGMDDTPPDTPFLTTDDRANETTSRPPPPDTSFFSPVEDDRDSGLPPPPPDTPFFSDNEEDDEVDLSTGKDADRLGESKLGTLEEQKLRSMYRRAGARTASEQEEIRRNWEEYQKYEKESRDISGLSDTDDSLNETLASSLISDATKDDGDIDAAKILAAIGPRPTKKRSNITRSDATTLETFGNASSANITASEKDQEKATRGSELDTADVSDQLYRAVAAVGGGRARDDPEAQAKEKAEFQEYLRKEEEARQSLDVMDDETSDVQAPVIEDETREDKALDDVEYAEKVLESIGPRPERKPKKEISSYEREYSDRGSAISEIADDDEGEGEAGSGEGTLDEQLPRWFRKEKEETKSQSKSTKGGVAEAFLGGEFGDEEEEYEKNIRQAEEFGQRRSSSGRPQMGIDISDVLGRSGNDQYNDYSYDDYSSPVRDSSRSFSSFTARKANLLEYTELDVRELNALMDHKESPYATGVSQYMKKINKPFKDFGAIFRLEGTLVDITGLQYEAWKKVAEAYDFKPPELEDVRLAAVTRPEIAVRKIFFWSDDLLVCREVAVKHRDVFRDVFNEWRKDQNINISAKEEETDHDTSDPDRSDIGEPMTTEAPAAQRTEKELNELRWQAWTKTAEISNFQPPSLDDVMVSAVVGPNDAVREIFKWTADSSEIAEVVKTYQIIFNELLGSPVNSDDLSSGRAKSAGDEGEAESQGVSKLDLEYMAWTKTAWEGGFNEPNLQEAWAAMVVNDPYAVVEEGFCWAEEPSEIEKIVAIYKKTMKELLESRSRVEMELNAWTRTAEERGFDKPLLKEAFAAMVVNDPYEVVEEGFGWSEEPAEIEEIVTIYKKAMENLKEEYGDILTPQTSDEKEVEVETDLSPSGPTAEEMFEMQVFSWTVAAEKHGFDPPLLEEIQVAANINEKDAIRRLFGWTDDEKVIDKVAATYQEARRKISDKIIQKYDLEVDESGLEKPPVGEDDGATRKGPTNDEMFRVSLDSWAEVARTCGYSAPSTDEVLFAMTVGPEDAILDEFEWTKDPAKAKEIAAIYKDALEQASAKLKSANGIDESSVSAPSIEAEERPPAFTIVPGAAKWVGSLLDVEMPCAVVSYLERDQVDTLLELAGLANLFPWDKRVSASNGYGRETQQLLGAALRLERRPDHCAFFDTTPESAVIAHEVDMKCVNMIGIYPMYDLLSADSTSRYFDELTAMNLRRLFGERVYDEPMLDMKETEPTKRRKVKTRFWEEGDRL